MRSKSPLSPRFPVSARPSTRRTPESSLDAAFEFSNSPTLISSGVAILFLLTYSDADRGLGKLDRSLASFLSRACADSRWLPFVPPRFLTAVLRLGLGEIGRLPPCLGASALTSLVGVSPCRLASVDGRSPVADSGASFEPTRGGAPSDPLVASLAGTGASPPAGVLDSLSIRVLSPGRFLLDDRRAAPIKAKMPAMPIEATALARCPPACRRCPSFLARLASS